MAPGIISGQRKRQILLREKSAFLLTVRQRMRSRPANSVFSAETCSRVSVLSRSLPRPGRGIPRYMSRSEVLHLRALLHSVSDGRKTLLSVAFGGDHFLAAVETGRADVVTTMDFTGRRFNSGRRVHDDCRAWRRTSYFAEQPFLYPTRENLKARHYTQNDAALLRSGNNFLCFLRAITRMRCALRQSPPQLSAS